MATQDVDSDYDDDEAPSDLSTTLRIEYVDASKAEGPVVAFERDLPGEDGPWEFTLGRNADAGPQRINDVAIQPDSVGRSHALRGRVLHAAQSGLGLGDLPCGSPVGFSSSPTSPKTQRDPPAALPTCAKYSQDAENAAISEVRVPP